MANGNFNQIGNLAFYDGWSPDYVYFKSLLNYAWANPNQGTWNTEAAGAIAAQAAFDATGNAIFPGTSSQEESDMYFLQKMQYIIAFLKKAIAYEQSNEKQYFDTLKKTLNKSFSVEEKKRIKQFDQLFSEIQLGEQTGIVKLDKINTLCNLILAGKERAELILEHEEKRMTAVQNRVNNLLEGRGNQAAGVGKKYNKSKEEQELMREKATAKLERKIIFEYTNTAQLTRTDHDGAAILWGGKSLEEIAGKTIERHFAEWVERMVHQVSLDKRFLNKLTNYIRDQYPVDGNFKLLRDDVQESIIQVIIQSGMADLHRVMNDDISEELIKEVEKNVMKNIDSKGVLDVAAKLDIMGLDNTFGRKIQEPKLLNEITTIDEIKSKSAEKLYSYIRKFIKEENAAVQRKPNKSNSYLIQAMNQTQAVSYNTVHETIFERTNNIIQIVDEIEELRQKIAKMQEQYDKKVKKMKTDQVEFNKQLKLSKNSKATIEIKVINGQVQVEQSSLLNALKNDSRLNSFHLKKDLDAKTLTSTLQTLKSRASKILKDEIVHALKKTNFGIKESSLVNAVKQELRSLDISISGSALHELMTTLDFRNSTKGGKGGVGIEVRNGKEIKNDSVHILVNPSRVRSKAIKMAVDFDRQMNDQLTKEVEEAQEKLLKEYQKVVDQKAQSLQKESERYSKMASAFDTSVLENADKDSELGKAYIGYQAKVKEYVDFLKKQSRGDEERENIEKYRTELLNMLQNSFYVSTTEKTHSDYTNSLGFVGGSIGGNLDQQLDNIADIFKQAGLEIPEAELVWLRSAIINCFPGSIVGEKNKGMIEQYLGSLIAFALFDEGGIEADIINNLSDKITKTGKHNSRKILHLYNVNGIYVTGSTVLQRTLDSIQGEIANDIQKIPGTIGAGITIINTASEKDIPNRPFKEHLNDARPDAWAVTGENVAKKVELKILFLAGLLDIMNSINNTLSNLPMPT